MAPHYFGLNAFFLEILRSREISREVSICQTRLAWWRQTVDDVLTKPNLVPKEPLAAMLKHIKVTKPHVKLQLLQRMVDY